MFHCQFLKSISTVSGKDINVFVDQWMYPVNIVAEQTVEMYPLKGGFSRISVQGSVSSIIEGKSHGCH